MPDTKLINDVLEQIQIDIIREDLTAIAEMLERLPEAVLLNYLSDCGYENPTIDLGE